MRKKVWIFSIIFIAFMTLMKISAFAEPIPIPQIGIDIGEAANPVETMDSIKLLVLLTVLTLAPSILILMTSFTRIIVVFSFLRNALGTQQSPPNQILVGLALFLTFFIMAPVYNDVMDNAVNPYLEETITQEEAIEIGSKPIKEFMLKQTREKDLALFIDLSDTEVPDQAIDTGFTVLVPAFVISELKTAFQIGFLLFIPFVIVDMVVASILMSMGMFMLSPVMISLPFKILLFVMVDGWNLVVKSLVESFI
ncbi:flagellar type III secretion system pore protein FliP [Clostridium grantii]|uniref:Flagellar biosynthetic protein FliP n=1 Tax=Clostridium grantii DSM 8605 TaxID=1121316 RepID=A0A1M5XJS0_9CLOT|nr:flagellar type III secretion system pore protein FliP [Clostridium grantii]SHH99798.1 flagellar biosynthetic protein FliP [Clostridium grantii DSM 8605]